MLGRSHPLLRRLRALRRDPALRRAEGVLVAEGLHLAGEALGNGAAIEVALVAPRLESTQEGRELRRRLEDARIEIAETSDAALDAVQDARAAQPILCIVRWADAAPHEVERLLATGALVVVAHGVQDPGNLGALLRTADAAGAGLAAVTGPAADLRHPRTVRASMGSILRLPSLRADLAVQLAQLRRHGYRVAAADPRGDVDYARADLGGPLGLLLGSEGSGLPPFEDAPGDLRLRIPLRRGVESLSVVAAAAVLLFAAARQRGP